jgi:hypothetical protein
MLSHLLLNEIPLLSGLSEKLSKKNPVREDRNSGERGIRKADLRGLWCWLKK